MIYRTLTFLLLILVFFFSCEKNPWSAFKELETKDCLDPTMDCDSIPDFSCPLSLIDERDGQEYAVVQIGCQCWMAQNLNYGQFIDNDDDLNDDIVQKFCYNDNESNCDSLGGYYDWNMAVNGNPRQGICPNEWCLPTKENFDSLVAYTDTVVWEILSEQEGGTNETGLSVLLGGVRVILDNIPQFPNAGGSQGRAIFWSSDRGTGPHAWQLFIGTNEPSGVIYEVWNNGSIVNNIRVNVRCIKCSE